jgi:hypothetical protein
MPLAGLPFYRIRFCDTLVSIFLSKHHHLEASQLLHQIVGPTHKETAQGLNLVTNIMIEGGDNETATDLALRNLSISVQIDGMDLCMINTQN